MSREIMGLVVCFRLIGKNIVLKILSPILGFLSEKSRTPLSPKRQRGAVGVGVRGSARERCLYHLTKRGPLLEQAVRLLRGREEEKVLHLVVRVLPTVEATTALPLRGSVEDSDEVDALLVADDSDDLQVDSRKPRLLLDLSLRVSKKVGDVEDSPKGERASPLVVAGDEPLGEPVGNPLGKPAPVTHTEGGDVDGLELDLDRQYASTEFDEDHLFGEPLEPVEQLRVLPSERREVHSEGGDVDLQLLASRCTYGERGVPEVDVLRIVTDDSGVDTAVVAFGVRRLPVSVDLRLQPPGQKGTHEVLVGYESARKGFEHGDSLSLSGLQPTPTVLTIHNNKKDSMFQFKSLDGVMTKKSSKYLSSM